MSRLRVGLLANPTAASGGALRIGDQTAHLLRVAGLSVVDVSGPTAAVARARALEVRDTLTALVVIGGDGTLSLGAEIVANTPVRLGVVPAGSGNDFARALRLPVGDPVAAVEIILEALSRPVVAIDAIGVRSLAEGSSAHPLVVLGNVSLGFDALVNARANRARRSGAARYTWAVLTELRAFRPIPYWFEIDGGPREEADASIVTIANSGRLGGGMRLVPDARVDDGRIELATVTGLGRARLVRLFPRVFRGSHMGIEGFTVREARSVRIGCRDERMLRSYGDGEPQRLLPLEASVLPGAIRILAPRPGAPRDGRQEEVPA